MRFDSASGGNSNAIKQIQLVSKKNYGYLVCMDELQKLAEQSGWPLEKQADFLMDRGLTQWTDEAIEEAKEMLIETLKMFGANATISEQPRKPRLYKELNGDDD